MASRSRTGASRGARGRSYPRSSTAESGPWIGVNEAPEEIGIEDKYLVNGIDVWFPPDSAGAWTRPGWTSGSATQMGGVGTRRGQCLYEHVRNDGTIDRFAFVGGKMYRWNGSDAGTLTDITPGTVTISTTARIFCTSFAGLLIVNDGVNEPWTYNHATTTATEIEIDTAGSAWSAYGQPAVYSGSLVFILLTKAGTTYQNAIVWSEAANPAVGYQQDGYAYYWELTQTDARPLYALAATNSYLYFFRENSIGYLIGTPSASFQAAATRDAVSQTVGTTIPASVIVANGYVWFMTGAGRVHRFAVGSTTIEKLWTAMRGTLTLNGSPTFRAMIAAVGCAAYSADVGIVAFTIWGDNNSSTATAQVYTFQADSGRFAGWWTFPGDRSGDTLAAMTTAGGYVTLCALVSSISSADDRGFLYRQKAIDEASWSESGCSASTRPLFDDPNTVKVVTQVVVEGVSETARIIGVSVTDMTETVAHTFSPTTTQPKSPGGSRYNFPARAVCGVESTSRSVSVTMSDTGSVTSTPIAFTRCSVHVADEYDDVGAK
jgi:hypothetical protein